MIPKNNQIWHWGGWWFSEDDLNMNGFRGRLRVEDMVK